MTNKVTIYDDSSGETHEYDGPLDSAIGAEVSRLEDAVGALSDRFSIKARDGGEWRSYRLRLLSDRFSIKARDGGEWRSYRVRLEYVRRVDVTGSAPCDDPTEDGDDE